MSVFLDGDLYIYIYDIYIYKSFFFVKKFLCFCCFFLSFFDENKHTHTWCWFFNESVQSFPLAPENSNGPFHHIRRWIPHVWPPKRVACRGVQVVWWRRPTTWGRGLGGFPKSGVVSLWEEKLEWGHPPKKNTQPFFSGFLVIGLIVFWGMKTWNSAARPAEMDEMESLNQQPVFDRIKLPKGRRFKLEGCVFFRNSHHGFSWPISHLCYWKHQHNSIVPLTGGFCLGVGGGCHHCAGPGGLSTGGRNLKKVPFYHQTFEVPKMEVLTYISCM